MQRLDKGQWRTVLELYQKAGQLPADQWRPFLDSFGHSPEIIHEVLALLDERSRNTVGSAATPAATADLTDTMVGHFLISGRLGRGGMGEVYLARDTQLGRSVALKFLAPEVTGVRSAVQKLIREARAASALNHPNIVTIHEVIQSQSRVGIVMELVEGRALRELCGTPLPVRDVVRIGRQVAGALAAAHSLIIVHSDIKPENVILRPDGCVKVLDFGLARLPAAAGESSGWTSQSGLAVGSLRYMSPEQARAERLTGA